MTTVELARVEKQIAEVEAIKAEVEAWERKVNLVHSLPQLCAERERLAAEIGHQEQVDKVTDKARVVVAQAVKDVQSWRGRFLELCKRLDAATTKAAAGAVYAELDAHIDVLEHVQAPLFEALAGLKVVAGDGYRELWRKAGGADPVLIAHVFKVDELGYIHRSYLKRSLRGKRVWMGWR